MDNRDTRVARFGTFEADPAARELLRAGRRINLQDQPFRLLLLLIEHPGEVVSREQIRMELWGETFVDFEDYFERVRGNPTEIWSDGCELPAMLA